MKLIKRRFNTVNGKYCCNYCRIRFNNIWFRFNTVNGKYCCNNRI